MSQKAPCYGCEERYPACWGNCEKYKTWAEAVAIMRKSRQDDGKTSESIWKVRGK